MNKRRRLGQHHLINKFFIEMIVDKAKISENDVVFELGTGLGNLTEAICQRASKVISCELDSKLYQNATIKLARFENLELFQGDGFNLDKRFDIFISNLPYSESKHFIQWSLSRRFKRAVVTVQKEFIEKLLAKSGERRYRAISIMAQAGFRMNLEEEIPINAFYPTPKVSSRIVVFEPKNDERLSSDTFLWLNKLFSFRGRKMFSVLKTFSKQANLEPNMIGEIGRTMIDRRIEDLTIDEAFKIAEYLSKL